ALRRHRALRQGCHGVRLSGHRQRALPHAPVADPQVRQSQARPQPGAAALRRWPREADLRGAAVDESPQSRLRGPSVHGRTVDGTVRVLWLERELSRRSHRGRQRGAPLCVLRYRLLLAPPRPVSDDDPLLSVRGLTKRYGAHVGCLDVAFDVWPGEVLGIVGESGSGKTTVLACLAGRVVPTAGLALYVTGDGERVDVLRLSPARRRRLARSEWGMVHQHARDGLRMGVSAGGN